MLEGNDHSLAHFQAQNQLKDLYKSQTERDQMLRFTADAAGLEKTLVCDQNQASCNYPPSLTPLQGIFYKKAGKEHICPLHKQMPKWTPGQGWTSGMALHSHSASHSRPSGWHKGVSRERAGVFCSYLSFPEGGMEASPSAKMEVVTQDKQPLQNYD